MSDCECVFAWTAPSAGDVSYPEYVNISVNDGKVRFTVRGEQKEPTKERPYAMPGDAAVMTLPADQLVEMINMPFRALQVLAKTGRLIV